MIDQNKTIYLISDSTGETALTMLRAAMVQFQGCEANIIRSKNVRTEVQVESIIEQANRTRGMIVYTVVSKSLSQKIREDASSKGLQFIDLLGPLLSELDLFFGVSSKNAQGILRVVDDKYYRRIEAIEFTVKHDDGKITEDLDQADIILVGLSRTSKTPLSIFLSHKGWKVANIPIVLETPLPKKLFEVDQRKVIALLINDENLHKIRKTRLEKFGQDPSGQYASLSQISKEIEYASELYKKNRRWPVLNVTSQALEETASEITRIITARMGYPTDVLF